MTELQQEIEAKIGALDFAALTALEARIAELLRERRSEVIARLEKEAALVGVSIHDANGVKPKRRRKGHHEE